MTAILADRGAFIRANTRLLTPPHCPEIQLYLADDAVALWELTEEELGEMGLPPPFWAFAWAGGQALARYILDNPDIVRGKSVLDVAAGGGVVAIAAMKAGARSVLAIDLDAFATEASLINAAENHVSIETQTGDALAAPPTEDVILVGDLFYDRDIAARLLAWLKAAPGAVLVGDPGRSYLPKEALEKVAEYAVPVSRALEDAEVKTHRRLAAQGLGFDRRRPMPNRMTPATIATAPISAQNRFPVMKLPGRMLNPCSTQTIPIAIGRQPTIFSAFFMPPLTTRLGWRGPAPAPIYTS
ncbi:MAG: methyltransferase [Alphaproteobacteria bacterium]